MEGKLPILFLFVILNNPYSSSLTQAFSQTVDASTSKPNLNTSSLKQQSTSRRNKPLIVFGENADDRRNGEGDGRERPLSVGDTFTPLELLPVTRKLIEKVDNPGEGKGIVSGARSPEDLADKLFGAFFFDNKRIIYLNEDDVSGLDALQALALSGQVTVLRANEDAPVTEATDQATINYRGQVISVNTEPIKSKYRLLTKKDNKKIVKKMVVRTGDAKFAEKLWKARHSIINSERKHNAVFKFSKLAGIKKNKTKKPVSKEPLTGKDKRYCHWKYECTNPSDLDTCRLKTDCNKNTPVVEFHGVPHLPDEHTRNMREFRKMLGISLVDEEVEKILERRYLKMKPSEGRPGPDAVRMESLAEYFNNIIVNDVKKTTEPYHTPRPTTEVYRPNVHDIHNRNQEESQAESEDNNRRNFETPTRSTPKPSDHNL